MLGRHAPIRRFSISGLHGYKDVEIVFHSSVSIQIAGNGSGKTTVLNALNDLLRGRLHKLSILQFSAMECSFSNGSTARFTKEQLTRRTGSLNETAKKLSDYGISASELAHFLTHVYRPYLGAEHFSDHALVRRAYSGSPYSYETLSEMFDRAHEAWEIAPSDELSAQLEIIERALSEHEIVYLPTWRRVEDPLLSPQQGDDPTLPFRSFRSRHESNDQDQINYGLDDVIARLNDLTEEIDSISNSEYRSASATIIDDALSGLALNSRTINRSDLPNIDSLERFLQRVSKSDEYHPYSSNFPQPDRLSHERIMRIRHAYDSGELERNPFLGYFLMKLGPVIERTKATEERLQKFVNACNSYLLQGDGEKGFTYEPQTMRVSVYNSYTKRTVGMGQLSSGEKQIISILAKLYLYEGSKIILIDEPELSLSIEWQRRIIPDMMDSGVVSQILAITHSPFIFENEFDAYAGNFGIHRHRLGTAP